VVYLTPSNKIFKTLTSKGILEILRASLIHLSGGTTSVYACRTSSWSFCHASELSPLPRYRMSNDSSVF